MTTDNVKVIPASRALQAEDLRRSEMLSMTIWLYRTGSYPPLLLLPGEVPSTKRIEAPH